MKEFEVIASGGRSAGPGHGGVEEHLERADYLQKCQLKSGSAGWVLLAGLGASYVVSGDDSGWNFGLAQGGFGGLAIAAVVIAWLVPGTRAGYGRTVVSTAGVYSRHRLVANSPDEKFAMLVEAESELK
jgi:hypothetical protein